MLWHQETTAKYAKYAKFNARTFAYFVSFAVVKNVLQYFAQPDAQAHLRLSIQVNFAGAVFVACIVVLAGD